MWLLSRWAKTGNSELLGSHWTMVRSGYGMRGLESGGDALKLVPWTTEGPWRFSSGGSDAVRPFG